MAATAGLSLTLDPMGKVSQNTSSQLSFSNKLYICEPRLRMKQQPNCTINIQGYSRQFSLHAYVTMVKAMVQDGTVRLLLLHPQPWFTYSLLPSCTVALYVA
jgi:hypothetical protein